MKYLFASALIAILFFSCNPLEKAELSLDQAIPANATLLLKINNIDSFKRELQNNDFARPLLDSDAEHVFFQGLNFLNEIESESEGLLAIIPGSNEHSTYLFATTVTDFQFKQDSLSPIVKSSATIQGKKQEVYLKDDKKYYAAIYNNVQFISTDSLAVFQTVQNIGQPKTENLLESLFTSSNSEKSATLFLRSNKSASKSGDLTNVSSSSTDISGYRMALDLHSVPGLLQWTGVALTNDSIPSFLSLLSNTQPVINSLAQLAPEDTEALLSLSFSDGSIFLANQKEQYPNNNTSEELFRHVEEIGIAYHKNQKAVLLNTFGANELSQYLSEHQSSVYDYQGKEIGVFEQESILEEGFPALIRDFKFTHFTILDNAFVFTANKNFLELIIREINSGRTFNNSSTFLNAKTELAEASSLFYVAKDQKMLSVLEELLPLEVYKEYEKAKFPEHLLGLQVVADHSFFHINTFLKRKETHQSKQGVSPLFTVQLDADLATHPQFVTDHRNNKKEIVVQDVENNLYLIATNGKILWKKKLQGRVQGKIEQIDLYKNGRLQLAFTTTNQFLVLDRNGKEVLPFNKTFSGPILNPLAVFDYEGNRNYRFVVTQENEIKMFNGKGDIVQGFNYTKAENAVLDAPKHFKIGSRDYLVFKLADGTLKILNRRGSNRLTIPEKIQFSENGVYLNNNRFIVTDKTGTLFAVDTKGKITRTRFNLNQDHGMDATVKTLSLMNDNELTIKGNKAVLDLGVYTKPRIFYIYDKIYVSVTDIQSQKAYLFDSNAILFPNFPVYANSPIDLTDMDNNRSIEIVTKFEENSLIVYSIN